MGYSWIVAIVLVVAAPISAQAAPPPLSSAVTPKTAPSTPNATEQAPRRAKQGKELRDAAKLDLRKWARPDNKDLQRAAGELLEHYHDVLRDNSLSVAQRRDLRLRLRTRLLAVARRIETLAVAQARREKSARPKSIKTAVAKHGPLPQLQGAGPMPMGALGRQSRGDDSEKLVDLIRSVVAPSTWSTNGGTGVIHYWQPGHAMVVRQTDQVHEDIADLLRQLRAAGR